MHPVRKLKAIAARLRFKNSKQYWERRYKNGGNSGKGSYGHLAEFKAKVINDFIKKHKISYVAELGCGDGNQLAQIKAPNYLGLDVSERAIDICKEKFGYDKTKSFYLHNKGTHFHYHDLALSLDVIFHLVEDDVFEEYMHYLLCLSNKYVIIYSSNTDKNDLIHAPHVKHRRFIEWIEKNRPEWKLQEVIKNKYPQESFADFYIYKLEGEPKTKWEWVAAR